MSAITEATVRKRQAASLTLNILIVLLELIGFSLSFRIHGVSLFQFYTQDSNLLMLLAGALLAAYTARALQGGAPVPAWVYTVKYMATGCLALTFLVVLLVLSPMEEGGYGIMLLSGSMLYHHLLCPLLALVSFLILETGVPFCRRPIALAFAPTMLYAVVAVALNLLSLLDGPYPFLRVREQPVYLSVIWFLLILVGAWLLSWLLLRVNRRGKQT